MTPAETRKHIRTTPWQPGHYGKGILSKHGKLWTWTTTGTGHINGDGHPWHREAAIALGYMAADALMTDATADYVRDMFSIKRDGAVFAYQGDPDTPKRMEAKK